MDANTIAGFVGVAIVVSAYFANQQGWLKSEDWRFPGANLIGSLLILASLWTAWNPPAAAIAPPAPPASTDRPYGNRVLRSFR